GGAGVDHVGRDGLAVDAVLEGLLLPGEGQGVVAAVRGELTVVVDGDRLRRRAVTRAARAAVEEAAARVAGRADGAADRAAELHAEAAHDRGLHGHRAAHLPRRRGALHHCEARQPAVDAVDVRRARAARLLDLALEAVEVRHGDARGRVEVRAAERAAARVAGARLREVDRHLRRVEVEASADAAVAAAGAAAAGAGAAARAAAAARAGSAAGAAAAARAG